MPPETEEKEEEKEEKEKQKEENEKEEYSQEECEGAPPIPAEGATMAMVSKKDCNAAGLPTETALSKVCPGGQDLLADWPHHCWSSDTPEWRCLRMSGLLLLQLRTWWRR